MKLLQLLLRSNAPRLLLAVLVSVVSGVSSAGLIAVVNEVWQEQLFTSGTWMAAFGGLLVVLLVSGVVAQLLVLDLALKAVVDLRMELSGKILSTPLRRIEELGAPRLFATLTEDVNILSRVLPLIPRIVIDGTTLVAGAVYMAWLSPMALAVVAGLMALGVAIYTLLMKRALVHMREGREVFDKVFDHFRALHEGLKQLKLNGPRRRHFLDDEMRESLESFRSVNMSGRVLLLGAENIIRLHFFTVLGAMIFAVPRIDGIEMEVLTGYVLMCLYLYRPLGSIMALAPEFGKAVISLEKVDKLGLSLGGSVVADHEPPREPPQWKLLELVGAKFSFKRYDDDREFTVGPVDLCFEPGEVVFVIGGNGSGKTTLAKVLTSLYPLEAGEILLDGVPIDDSNREDFRQLFSVVFSDFHLFDSLPGDGNAELDKRAEGYLTELMLNHKVTVSKGCLSTTDLSQGQRKRLALLTAYLEDRPFYIFDEWAADQDPEFKEIFYTKILPELKQRGKTVFAITHDDRFLCYADRCLKLEEGRVSLETVVESN